MPNIFDLYSNAVSDEQVENQAPGQDPNIDSDYSPNDPRNPNPMQGQGQEPQRNLDLSGGATNDPKQNKAAARQAYNANQLGATSQENSRDLYEDPNSWSPEYANKGFLEESGTSILRGVGNHLVKGTGDMLQVIGGLLDEDLVKGNFISTALQNAGGDMAEKFKSYIPEELQGENITWGSMMNPKFWSTQVAEMIPQLAEFILLSKGGSALARKGLGGILKKSASATKLAGGNAVPMSGKGVIGKLATEAGLSGAGNQLAGAVGGGVTGNLFSGLLNAAEVINTNKDLKAPDGSPLYSEEELQEMASGTIKNNASYVMMDIASWGLTFGGGWKALKGMNPVAKGGKLWSGAQQSKIVGKMFAYDTAPIFKAAGRVGKKAFAEGMEEQVQESWEEWAKMKAVEKVQGGSGDLLDSKGNPLGSFYDFFTSKENEATRVLSFAVGALGGGAFNIKDAFNKKADDSYLMYDRAKNIKEIVDKQGTDKQLEWQEYHIRQTMADISADDKGNLYEDFANNLVQNGNITEDEKAKYDEIFKNFEEVKQNGKKLNVKGMQALLFNNATQTYADNKLEEFELIAKENIDLIKANEGLNEIEKAQKISEIEQSFAGRLKSLSLLIAESKQNQSNLIIGKKASALTVDIVTDKYGNDQVIGGLSTKQFEDLTKEGEKEKSQRTPMEKLKLGDLKETGKNIYNKSVEKGMGAFEGLKKAYQEAKAKKAEGKNETETDLSDIEAEYDVEFEQNINKKDGTKTVQAINKKTGTLNPEATKIANERIVKENEEAEVVEAVVDKDAKQPKQEKKKTPQAELDAEETAFEEVEEEAEAEEMAPKKPLETIDNETYTEFQNGKVSDELLDTIAERVNKEEGLSERENEIRQTYKDDILDRIVKLTLGTGKKVTKKTEPNTLDNLSQKEKSNIEKENGVVVTKTKDGYTVTDTKTGEEVDAETKKTVDGQIDNLIEEKYSIKNDGDLTDSENQFMKEEADPKKKSGQSIQDDQKKKTDKAKKDFKVDPKNVSRKALKDAGLDARNKRFDIGAINVAAFHKAQIFLQKLGLSKDVTERENISQNEIDNYLNTFSVYNQKGPAAIDKMAVVNHNLKNMFPNQQDPAQVIIVKNLFEAIGSQGLGSTLAGTVYIDEKSWEQEWVFMHEMSHIFYQLSKNDPTTQGLVKMALANQELVKKIKGKYDDYTIYNMVNSDGKLIEITKGQYISELLNFGADKNMIDQYIAKAIKDGDLQTIPLKDQKYIVEEMFVDQLEKGLTPNLDKVFNVKNEPKRQKDVKKWWGMLRKKGEIIENEDGVANMLSQLYDSNDIPQGSLKDFVVDTFKAVTKGVQINGISLDARADKQSKEYVAEIKSIKKRLNEQINNEPDIVIPEIEALDRADAQDNALENDGQMFFDKGFESKVKSASRIIRRFGVVYNKTLRAQTLLKTKNNFINRGKIKLFDRDLFESTLYNLAKENDNTLEFIYNIEKSSIKEIQSFNRYLNKVNPSTKLQLLNSMHLVFSNSKHITGHRNIKDDAGNYGYVNSLSNREKTDVDNVITSMRYSFDERANNSRYNNYIEAVNNIYKSKIPNEGDILAVIDMLAPRNFRFDKIREQGFLTYKGVNVPIETLITGFIKRGYLFNIKGRDKEGNPVFAKLNGDFNQVYYAAARPIVEAMVNTNRKFTPVSSVLNAEGNMEPLRITNNHLTKEVDNMIEYLGEEGMTKQKFIDRFSHITGKDKIKKKRKNGDVYYKNPDGTTYVPNQFLENIYDQYQNGIQPTVSQYHGLQDTSNNKGSLYKNSTALEQGIEDLLTFIDSSVSPEGTRKKTYLANMGAFSDSPRKFFMNMKRIAYDEVFTTSSVDGKQSVSFNRDGKIINSIFAMNAKLNPGDPNADKGTKEYMDYRIANDKNLFKKEFRKAVSQEIKFANENANALAKIKMYDKQTRQDKMSEFVREFKEGEFQLTGKGKKLVSEHAINSIVNGFNISDTFLPSVKGKDTVKRFKMNSSPVISVKNPNFKVEFAFFNDEEINDSIAGTDSGMYILEEHAEKFQRLGKGVFDMQGGFKFLNASVEKDNPNFKGKAAYLKGYTTIIGKTHRLYPLMKARTDKYNAWHKEKYGEDPSMDLNDNTPNHVVVAVPQSSDKSNFIPESFNGKDFSEDTLAENIEDANKYYDNLYYNKKGDFVGVSAYNFGVQQLMDKTTNRANTPVQMVNSIIVNATANGKLDEAYEIQQLLSDQKRANLQMILDQIGDGSISSYKKLIMDNINREDMNQAQRILLDDNGSLAAPYVNEIVVNQLAKTIRREGNKLITPGTYAHQKPDSGWRTMAKGNKSLNGYTEYADGSLGSAEIVLPNHMSDKVAQRTKFTQATLAGQASIRNEEAGLSKSQREKSTPVDKMNSMYYGALKLAKSRHNVDTKGAQKYIVKEYDAKSNHIGYIVKGDEIIASRVPGDGPSSTGVFEVIGFDPGQGNQVMVSSQFNDIIGSDNDGDALFIQTKANLKDKAFSHYGDWNNAFDKIKKYWLSKEMAPQVTVKMQFDKETEAVVENIEKVFTKNKDYVMPHSPKGRRNDYNNTMVSKRNVGPVFNIHKLTNILAATNVPITRQIEVGYGKEKDIYDMFKDTVAGKNSRNQNSAILANIILDNAKDGFADSLGLDEYNISQAVLMVNLGIPLEKVGLILNSPAAKMYSDLNRSNNSMYHDSYKKSTIIKQLKKHFKIDKDAKIPLKIDLNTISQDNKNQAPVIELMDYLANMNSEVQKISTIMGGHNRIHVNPLVLEKQIADYDETIANKDENTTIQLTDEFKRNPDLLNYIEVARETLKHQQNLNPVYSSATVEVLRKLTEKIGNDLSATQIENISNDILQFSTSRLLSHNNKPKEYVDNLLSRDPNNIESIYNKLQVHFKTLRDQLKRDGGDISKSYTMLENSVLFGQAISFIIDGTSDTKKFISANTSFVNDSFNEVERERAQAEFASLPKDLRNDLILYDMVERGFKGPFSLAPFFSDETNFAINYTSTDAMQNKNRTISPAVLKELEKIVALRAIRTTNNPFDKVYVKSGSNEVAVVSEIFNDTKLFNKLKKGQPVYINVIEQKGKGKDVSKLYELEEFTDEEVQQITTERSWSQKRQRTESIARTKMKEVPNTLNKNSNIDLTTITDKNLGSPYSVNEDTKENPEVDFMVEASINYEEVMAKIRANQSDTSIQSLDAREDFYIDLFTKREPLTKNEWIISSELKSFVSPKQRETMYQAYIVEKKKANKLIDEGILEGLENKTSEELTEMYNKFGDQDVYAFSGIVTPVVKQLSKKLIKDQGDLLKKNGVESKLPEGDVSAMKAYLMTGSTIPSNHPASQGLARMLEKEYKNFMGEKKKYMQEMNKVTDALYKDRLGYGGTSRLSFEGIKNFAMRLKDAVFSNRADVYDRLYGNMVIREEYKNNKGTLVFDYKLRPVEEIQKGFDEGTISQAEKDFYDFFKKTTNELRPKDLKEVKKDYIPHTSMSKLEVFSNRGILGLLSTSRKSEEAIYDVKLKYGDGIANFKRIEDDFKYMSARGAKNDINKIKEYRAYKKKAEALLKTGKNEDGSEILVTDTAVNSALGFGAINRFSNNRSVKSTELPSMDLNKALGDYIHSTLFVNGNKGFKGMLKLQGYIDGVLAYNENNNLPNMNTHIQTVWKDYFLRGKRQESFLGETGDRVVLGLTRLNLFYALGYSANVNTGGMYALGNVLAGKYHNIKELGGKAWLKGEARFWGLDEGFKGGISGVQERMKRNAQIMKNLNFMEINVYDEVSMESKGGLDRVFTDIALSPMIYSEKWIQQVHMLGKLSKEELNKFDSKGNYKKDWDVIPNERLVQLEDEVKSSHGRGYQPTDQRAVQMYSWGNMMLQFSRFIPTMVNDRFAKQDVNIYGKETIGTMRSVGKMLRYVMNNPKDFIAYRKSLSPDMRNKLDQGLRGVAMSSIISLATTTSDTANDLFWDANYYWDYERLLGKVSPAAYDSTSRLVGSAF